MNISKFIVEKNYSFQYPVSGLMVKYIVPHWRKYVKEEQNMGRKKGETDLTVTALGQLL